MTSPSILRSQGIESLDLLRGIAAWRLPISLCSPVNRARLPNSSPHTLLKFSSLLGAWPTAESLRRKPGFQYSKNVLDAPVASDFTDTLPRFGCYVCGQ